jgi:hypothetical protein
MDSFGTDVPLLSEHYLFFTSCRSMSNLLVCNLQGRVVIDFPVLLAEYTFDVVEPLHDSNLVFGISILIFLLGPVVVVR